MSAEAELDSLVEDEFHLGLDSIIEDGNCDDTSAPETACSHTSGRQLRRRLVTAESIAQLAAMEKPSLLQRLLRRH
ncbi:hypothetical protein [Novosphingobium malaysiense]|uniref:Uncharacterized protein n=1 Tax=Novosphingobium malaysiense TaxID=1348853 RepID=A0A0B1ZPM0_9SPHN|nr:hypothetical protein [Novosphingobium malaysiense]KHK91097.1 hypothetical protein LK12_09260 [Novosphingobium malaysiense]